MTKSKVLIILLFLAGCAAGLVLTIHAQTLPATVTAAWSPNPAADAVIRYTVQVDAGTPITVLPIACSATDCTTPVTFPTTGPHTLTVTAVNVFGSGTSTLQVNVVLPTKPAGVTIR